jgi:hypothetical protein
VACQEKFPLLAKKIVAGDKKRSLFLPLNADFTYFSEKVRRHPVR